MSGRKKQRCTWETRNSVERAGVWGNARTASEVRSYPYICRSERSSKLSSRPLLLNPSRSPPDFHLRHSSPGSLPSRPLLPKPSRSPAEFPVRPSSPISLPVFHYLFSSTCLQAFPRPPSFIRPRSLLSAPPGGVSSSISYHVSVCFARIVIKTFFPFN